MKKHLILSLLLILVFLTGCASISSTEYMAQVEKNVWRGSRQSDLTKLNQFGKIINLETENEYVYAERQYAADHNILWHHYPMSESPFIRPDVMILREIVNDIKASNAMTYIHCRRGKDRTGYAIAAYRILVDGWDVETAYKEAIDYGHASFFYLFWKPVLTQFKAKGGDLVVPEKIPDPPQ